VVNLIATIILLGTKSLHFIKSGWQGSQKHKLLRTVISSIQGKVFTCGITTFGLRLNITDNIFFQRLILINMILIKNMKWKSMKSKWKRNFDKWSNAKKKKYFLLLLDKFPLDDDAEL
tara:strand:+ start:13 stop:366 length:354 start_codon:yes stop_codon:yes gene_type:complete